MIPTLRRSRDDIFLIGEEQLPAAQDGGADPDPTIAIEEAGGPISARPVRSPHLPGSLQGARGLVVLGLGAGTLALAATLELVGGKGPAPAPPRPSSPRPPLISRSAVGAPAGLPARARPRTDRPAEVHRPRVVHHRPRHRVPSAPVRTTVARSEPEREPTPPVAPVSSPAATVAEPAPTHEAPPAADPTTPPGPPPSSSGGGPAGVESFGFER